ncbi:hypothetical protein [Salinibacter altiplanensis]|uniref:hypothetical protein n=1 Tax=Salinibacter altiplanensis TaxID=1803181 RepID=UPI000C9F0253|nr:hypothetical protein [Salinibacter altiplanensis]
MLTNNDSPCYLQLGVKPGEDIEGVAKQACSVARQLGLTVEVEVKGYTLLAQPGDRAEQHIPDYYEEMEERAT